MQTHLHMPPIELGAGEVHLSKVQYGEEIGVPLKQAHHSHGSAHIGDISFVASSGNGDGEGTLLTEGAPVPATTGVSGTPFCARMPKQHCQAA